MNENLSSKKCAEPFKDCYDDPTFELDEDGDIVDYVLKPEDIDLLSLHIVGVEPEFIISS